MNAPHNIRDIEKQDKSPNNTKGLDGACVYDEIDPLTVPDRSTELWGVALHWFFAVMAILAIPLYGWTWRWWKSGTPLLMFVLMAGRLGWLSASPILLGWVLVSINIAFALANTSWLFYDMYIISCYPTVCVVALLSSPWLQSFCRRGLRSLIKNFHFYEDKLAFFDIPALDIDDGDVPVLLVIRGFTFTFSTMTLEVHGVEVGVKLNEDVEIAIQTDSFTWRIMREINIGDIYASLKGPFTEKKVHRDENQSNRDATNDLTQNQRPSTTSNLSHVKTHGDFDVEASKAYTSLLERITESNTTHKAREKIDPSIDEENKIRAAIGGTIFADVSVPNPPKQQMKTSRLKAKVPNWVIQFFKKVPVLLRLFLNPVSYNHPVHFKSIVLTGCGKWLNQILDKQFFKYYPEENKEIRKLHNEVHDFLVDGKFSIILPNILGLASVPFMTQYDILTFIKAEYVLVHKSTQYGDGTDVLCVDELAQIQGAAATFSIPSCLLPNHEYLLPEVPADIHEKDAVNVKMSVLASLPGKFDPAMIDFAIAVTKASQVLSLHKQATSMSEEVHSPTQFGRLLGRATKEQTKKKLVEAHVDDAWLYKLIIKAFNALRKARGDLGYQMDIPVEIKDLRAATYVRRASTTTTSTESRRSSLRSETSEVNGQIEANSVAFGN